MGRWTSVEDRLPFEGHKWERVACGEFFVTVELDDKDPCDDRETTILLYSQSDGWTLPDGRPYTFGWHVTHWMKLPPPAED